jgi:hypothetical protein
MGDIIRYTCVLKKGIGQAPDSLALAVNKSGSDNGYREIPCHPDGEDRRPRPGMPDVMWTYQVRDGRLHLYPSLLCQSANFHTDYNWSVDFIECPQDQDEMDLFMKTNPSCDPNWGK